VIDQKSFKRGVDDLLSLRLLRKALTTILNLSQKKAHR
jgi:hypothetical protein